MTIATPDPILFTTVFGYIYDNGVAVQGVKVRFKSLEYSENDNSNSIDTTVTSDVDGRYQAVLSHTVNTGTLVEVTGKYQNAAGDIVPIQETIVVGATTPISVQAARAISLPPAIITGGPQGPVGATGAQGPQGLPGSAENVINLQRSVDGAAVSLDGSTAGQTPDLYLVDPDTGDMTITIPDAGFSAGVKWRFYKKDTDANKVTIQTVSGDLIGGEATQEILQKTSGITILDDTTEYRKLQDSRSQLPHEDHVHSVDGATLNITKPTLMANPDTGVITATLPNPADNPDKIFILKNEGTSGNDLIINSMGGELINGSATQTIEDGKSIMVFSLADDDVYQVIQDSRRPFGSPVDVGTANADGVSTDIARADHVHAHGTQTDGTLHADVIAGGADGFMTGADKTKLDGIEAGATADQSDAEIKTAYENNADTNEFSDAEQTKLAGIEAGATADQSDAEIKTAYENNADTNEFSDAEQTKLAGISAGAEVNEAHEYLAIAGTSGIGGNTTELGSWGNNAAKGGFPALFDGEIIAIGIRLNAAITAGTCEAQSVINGVAQNGAGETADLASGGPAQDTIQIIAAPIAFNAGDIINLQTVTAGAAPTGADATMTIIWRRT
jgi:hypothetical protein